MRLLIVLACVFTVGGAIGQKPGSDPEDQMTYRAICGSCHGTSLVEGLRTEQEWREEVAQMVKIGARGTEAQFETVFRVLARTLTKVNVNTAEAERLAPVLDVSAATALEMVKRRASAGGFKTLEELKRIPGVDPVKLEARKERILF